MLMDFRFRGKSGHTADIAAMTWFGTTDLAPADCRLIRFTALRRAFYLASMAVTSTSIAMLGHANWLTTRKVDAGIGALPNASARHFKAS